MTYSNSLQLKDIPKFRKWCKSLLMNNVMTVEFINDDGSKCNMRCTLNKELMPELSESNALPLLKSCNSVDSKKSRASIDTPLEVWDLDVQAWRFFYVNRVLSVSFILE